MRVRHRAPELLACDEDEFFFDDSERYAPRPVAAPEAEAIASNMSPWTRAASTETVAPTAVSSPTTLRCIDPPCGLRAASIGLQRLRTVSKGLESKMTASPQNRVSAGETLLFAGRRLWSGTGSNCRPSAFQVNRAERCADLPKRMSLTSGTALGGRCNVHANRIRYTSSTRQNNLIAWSTYSSFT
jgi:hypothetical protein